VQGSKQGFRAEDAKRPQCNDDEIDDDEGGGREKDVARRVMSITTYDGPIIDPKYLDWLEHPITFSRANQWVDIPYLGCFPLVLDLIT
jgi:hypothetical protein